MRKYGVRSNGRKMNGKAEKQQGREAAGGFRATIEGFPLLEKEPRAYGKREREKEKGSKRTRARVREKGEREALVDETERRGTRRPQRAGERQR